MELFCRYSVVFPLICAHFLTNVHQDLCPEERHSIGQTSVQYCNWFLKEMSDEVDVFSLYYNSYGDM